MDVAKETQDKINQLQNIEQNLQVLLSQRQQFQMQLIELESAETELGTTDVAYKIVGNIMVKMPKDQLKKSVMEKKESLMLRVKTLENQEEKLKNQSQDLQKEVLKKV